MMQVMVMMQEAGLGIDFSPGATPLAQAKGCSPAAPEHAMAATCLWRRCWRVGQVRPGLCEARTRASEPC